MRARKGEAELQSGYKGVVWSAIKGKWLARFTRDGRTYQVGYFDNEHEAAAELAKARIDAEQDVYDRARAAGRGTCGLPLAELSAQPPSETQKRIAIAQAFLKGKEVKR